MWPYDYFNEYSALINEFDIDDTSDKKRKVFIAKWYGERVREKSMIAAIKETDKKILKAQIVDRRTKIVDDVLRYGLIKSMPKDYDRGDINIRILTLIIQARIFIADITPENLHEILKAEKNTQNKGRNLKPRFNHNTMIELGLALAWKCSEQVIIIYDDRFTLNKYKLPFDIQDYFCHPIPFRNQNLAKRKLRKILLKRINDLGDKKNIVVNNIVSKIDGDALNVLQRQRRRPFPENAYNLETLRRLLDLGVIRLERYPIKPDGTMDHIYSFTELGSAVLKKLNIKQVPKIFADLYIIRFLEGYKETHLEQYKEKHAYFKKEHKVSWDKCNKYLIEEFKRHRYNKSDDIVKLYENYFQLSIIGKSFESFDNEIIRPWFGKLNRR